MCQNKRHLLLLKKKSPQGFSLIEVVVAMGVFALLMAVVVLVFSGGFSTYRNTSNSQKYLENAQYLMNDIVKQLRTSSVVSPTGNPAFNTSPVSITFFDHSQSKCFMYRQHLAPNYIEKAIGTAGTAALCNTAPGFGSWTRVTTGEVTMNLIIQDSVLSTRIGKVTMSFSVGGGAGSVVTPILLQSTVSLRDYKASLGL
ncbi:MAG: type II secretion system protein [Candidatus Moranbacteria bacterium]|jgi:prepilin-type N-terminal cleavage/methylation domain-containing protein|nr:type II secretion system protein [Candidatus Moranbacteria bacterium]MBP9801250.1 type II secretion system protein [Candidatus Moranbacteria bacterium]